MEIEVQDHNSFVEPLIGCGAAFFYAFFSALARVFVERLGSQLNPLISLLFSLVVATLFFHLLNLNKISNIYKMANQHKKDWCYVMLATSVLWTAFFIGPYYIGADIYTICAFATSGLIGALLYYLNNKKNIILMLIICIFYLFAFYFTLLDETINYKHVVGLILAVLSGATLYLYSKYSSRLQNQAGLSTSATLAVRWWLALIIIFMFCYNQLGQFVLISPILYLKMLVPTFLGIIIPAYLLLTSAVKIGPRISSIIISITPFLTVLFATLVRGKQFSSSDIIASTLIAIAVLLFQLPVFIKKK